MNIIATGYSEKHKQLVGVAADQVRQELENRRGAFSLGKLFREMRTVNKVNQFNFIFNINEKQLKMLDRESFEDAVKQLVLEGFLLRTGDKARVVADQQPTK